MRRCGTFIFWSCFLLLLTGCVTYYARNARFQEAIGAGNPQKALTIMEADSRSVRDKDRVLYYLHRGYTYWSLNRPDESIVDFQAAEDLLDMRSTAGSVALSMVSNPMARPYEAEDFEKVLINWFKAINFLDKRDFGGALVECRRMNLKLQELNDKYPDHKNRYQNDAFAHLMMGLIYEATFDYNNAFIAYRNAFDIYQQEYPELFSVHAPAQLKKDLLRTAFLTGFYDEVDYYEQLFQTKYEHHADERTELILFWMNGMGPVKAESGLQFTSIKGESGWASFYNSELDLTVPFSPGSYSGQERNALSGLSVVRVAVPRYQERKPALTSARLRLGEQTYPLEEAQNIQRIAVRSLQDRIVRELSSALIRLAVKQGLEALARKENKYLGTAVSLINAFTEKADTRNWQTLPYNIFYVRIPLDEGENNIVLEAEGPGGTQTTRFSIHTVRGRTYFKTLHSTRTME